MGKCTKCGATFVGTPENPPPDGLCHYCEFDNFLQQDRLKTAEINILVKENREMATQVRLHAEELIKLRARIERLSAALDAATDVGIYAASLRGAGPDKDYEKRTEFMEGWNACQKEVLR